MKRSRILNIFIILILLFSCLAVFNKLDIEIIENVAAADCIIQNETMYWSFSGEINISIWDTGEDPVSPENYTLIMYNDNDDNVTQFLTIEKFNGYFHIFSNSWGIDSSTGFVYGDNGTWSVDISHINGDWGCTGTWNVMPAPSLLWVWVDDDGAVWSDADTNGIIPYIPDVYNVPLDIQFKLYDQYGDFFGDLINGQASGLCDTIIQCAENITISGNSLFTGKLSNFPGFAENNNWYNSGIWHVPIIPTMDVGGGTISINVNAYNSSVSETISIGGVNYWVNGSVVDVTPSEFQTAKENQTLEVTARYSDDGSDMTVASVYLFYIDDTLNGSINGICSPIAGHIVGWTGVWSGGIYSIPFSIAQQTINQTIAGFSSIESRRNLTIFVDGSGHRDGYSLIEMIPPQFETVYVDDDYSASTPGWGYDHFDSIQDGIDAVVENGTVYVYNGIYYENVVVNKSIDIIGENKNNTIIDGGVSGHVISLFVDSIILSNFTIQSSGSYHNSAIEIKSNQNNIYNCIINSSSTDCIWLYDSHYNTIKNIFIFGAYRGMLLQYCTFNTIVGNTIRDMSTQGIYLEYGPSNHDNIIYHNNLRNNSVNAIDTGINYWNNSTIQQGNYWDDYTGEDDDGDGIGDTPYNISGGSNQDLFPLMYQYGWNADTIEVFAYPSQIPLGITTTVEITVLRNGEPYEGAWVSLLGCGVDIGNSTSVDGNTTFEVTPPTTGNISIKVNYVTTDATIQVGAWTQPVANFTYEVDGATVTFDASSSYDPDGEIVTWLWDFGDSVEGAGEIVEHTYSEGGTFEVTLTVIDNDGYDDNITKSVEVEAVNEFETALVFGRIADFNVEGGVFTFDSVMVRYITFSPFYLTSYYSGETIAISQDYIGLLTPRFVIALCNAYIEET